MGARITDPALLAQLNAADEAAPTSKRVTDPALLAELNAPDGPAPDRAAAEAKLQAIEAEPKPTAFGLAPAGGAAKLIRHIAEPFAAGQEGKSFKGNPLGVLEAAPSALAYLPTKIASGYAGLAGLPFGIDTAAKNVKGTQEGVQKYLAPVSREGQIGLNAISAPFQLGLEGIKEGTRAVAGDTAADVVGGGAEFGLDMLGLKGAPKTLGLGPNRGGPRPVNLHETPLNPKTELIEKPQPPTKDELLGGAGEKYIKVRESGLTYSGDAVAQLRDRLLANPEYATPGFAKAHPETAAALDVLRDVSGDSPIRNIEALRTLANTAKLKANGKPNGEGAADARLAGDLKAELDSFIHQPPEGAATTAAGNTAEVLRTQAEARGEYARGKSTERFDKVLTDAQNSATSNKGDAIRTELRQILDSPKEMAKLTPEVRAAVQDAMKGNLTDRVLSKLSKADPSTTAGRLVLGSLALAGAPLTGGLSLGAIAALGGGAFAKKLSGNRARGKVGEIQELTRRGPQKSELSLSESTAPLQEQTAPGGYVIPSEGGVGPSLDRGQAGSTTGLPPNKPLAGGAPSASEPGFRGLTLADDAPLGPDLIDAPRAAGGGRSYPEQPRNPDLIDAPPELQGRPSDIGADLIDAPELYQPTRGQQLAPPAEALDAGTFDGPVTGEFGAPTIGRQVAPPVAPLDASLERLMPEAPLPRGLGDEFTADPAVRAALQVLQSKGLL